MTDTISSSTEPRASGRFLLRMDPGLHAALREAARAAGLSLNEYCVLKLAAPAGSLAGLAGASQVVRRAGSLFGGDLLAVAVFGSWVRQEHGEGSDVDVLTVLDRRVPIRRELYRPWDEEPLELDTPAERPPLRRTAWPQLSTSSRYHASMSGRSSRVASSWMRGSR
jgi:hypothetical protein